MSEFNEIIAGLTNGLSLSMVTDRSWFEIASILTPAVALILVLFGFSFTLQNRNWKIVAFTAVLLLTLLFLPYELFRQSYVISKAQTNISEMQTNLKTLLNVSDLDHIENLVDKEVASSMLEELIDQLDQKQRKELIFISWLVTENEKQSLRFQEDSQKLFADEIKSSLNEAKKEIIATREPVDKISEDILQRLDEDISVLIENKMQSFNYAIDRTLDTFQQGIHSYMQNEHKIHIETLSTLTQQSVDKLGNELTNYTTTAKQEIAEQIKHINQRSLKKLDQLEDTVENINLHKVGAQINQLSDSIALIQKQNDIRFEYNECIRSAGLIDLAGKEEECKKKLYQNMNELFDQ